MREDAVLTHVLTETLLDELIKALALSPTQPIRRAIAWITGTAIQRFGMLASELDCVVGKEGIAGAARWLLPWFVRSHSAQGVEKIPLTGPLVIASNLVAGGIPVNNSSRGIIATIPISAPPGSQINYSPTNVIWFDAQELIGGQRSNLQFSLLDQNLREAPTGGESYSFVILIRWHDLLSTGHLPLRPA